MNFALAVSLFPADSSFLGAQRVLVSSSEGGGALRPMAPLPSVTGLVHLLVAPVGRRVGPEVSIPEVSYGSQK